VKVRTVFCILIWLSACRPEPVREPELPLEKPAVALLEDARLGVLLEQASQSVCAASLGLRALETNYEWVPSPALSYFDRARQSANMECLAEYFSSISYTPPERTFLLAARVIDSNGGPAFEYYSLGETGFLYSVDDGGAQRFWPASTVKLAAAVAALEKLYALGFDGHTMVMLEDEHGPYAGSLRDIVRASIVKSSNPAYNYTMMLVGFDAMNDEFLTPEKGFPFMVLQRRYQRLHKDSSMRESVPIELVSAKRSLTLPRRMGTREYPECPREGNCCTLFELMEVMRRVTLHDELEESERFDIAQEDASFLEQVLLKAPSCIEDGAQRAYGEGTKVYNKGGKVTADDRLDVALVLGPSGERSLIALSVKYLEGIEVETNLLAERTLEALRQCAGRAPALQRRAVYDGVQLDWRARALYLCGPEDSAAGQWQIWIDGKVVQVQASVFPGCVRLLPEGEAAASCRLGAWPVPPSFLVQAFHPRHGALQWSAKLETEGN
jgi:hypothetical protein